MLKTLFARRMPLGLLLMLLLSTQIVATDLYLPALPQIASYFNRPAGQAQWTLTLFILSFGVAQLGAGSLVDHYGRRKVLLWGLGLYVLASTGGALAMQLPWLMLCRALQGAATSVCVISARAIVRDNYSGAAGLGIMARNMTGMGVVGVLSPLLGGLVAQHLGWHVTLVLMAVFGLLVWLSVYLWFADSYVRPDHIGDVMFFRFFTHPQFIFSSLIAGISFSGAVCFLLLSSFAFIGEFGLSRLEYGVMPALCTLAFLTGTVMCRRLLLRWSVARSLRFAVCLSLLGGISEFFLWQFHVRSVLAMMLPQCVFMLGHGFHQPCGQGGAVSPFPDHAGRAAAVSGFVMTTVAFLIGQLVSHSHWPASQTLVVAMVSIALVLGVLVWLVLPLAYPVEFSDKDADVVRS